MATSIRTRGLEVAGERIKLAAAGKSHYPKGSVFLATDQLGHEKALADYLKQGRTIVLVDPSGRERIIGDVPVSGIVRFFARVFG